MRIKTVLPSFPLVLALILISMDYTDRAVAQQEPIFELPVQLVGFPVIILAVRLSNFVKKFAYSINPKTYQSRARRSPGNPHSHLVNSEEDPIIDDAMAEKRILEELGPKACVLEEPCVTHASRLGRVGEQPDWNDILRNYRVQRSGMKQWYLLSVFLGDVIRDISLCKRLSKRLQCDHNVQKQFEKYYH